MRIIAGMIPCLVAALALAACGSAIAPPVAAPVAVPANWSQDAPVTRPDPLVDWWRRFDDPVLDRLIALALQANGDVNTAEATLRQARALRDSAAAALSPNLNLSASAARNKAAGQDGANQFNTGFDAAWEADVFGARRHALGAAEADARSAGARLGSVRLSVAAEVALAYLQLRSNEQRLGIARDNLASQLETLQITGWRVQAGLLTSVEGEQARSASEQTRAQVPALASAIAQLRHSLALLCARTPDALPRDVLAAASMPQAPTAPVPALPADTLRQRPDVAAAEFQVVSARAQFAQADAARYPDFSLSGSLGLRALSAGALGGAGSVTNAVLASASMPLFDGGAIDAQVRARGAALEQAQVAYRTTVLTALREVEDALAASAGDRERVLYLTSAAEAAGNAALLARQRFTSGLIDFQTVLETQRTLFSTQDTLASARYDLSADQVRLYKALGGGWQDAPAATPPAAPPTPDSARNLTR